MLVLITQGDQREHLGKTTDKKGYIEKRTREILMEYLGFHDVTLVYLFHDGSVTDAEQFAESVLDTGICRIFDEIEAEDCVYFNSGEQYEAFIDELRQKTGTLRSEIEIQRSVTSTPFDHDRYPTIVGMCRKHINTEVAKLVQKHEGCRLLSDLSHLSDYVKIGKSKFSILFMEKTDIGTFPRTFEFNSLKEIQTELENMGWEFVAAATKSEWGSVEMTPVSQRTVTELDIPFLLQTDLLIQITEEEWENAPDKPYPLPTDRDLSEESNQ